MEPMNNEHKYQMHRQLCSELNEIYVAKNIAYGDSVSETFRKLGPISFITRMSDKMNRIIALNKGAENNVKDEKLEDSIKDLANYCLIFLIELELAGEGAK